MCDILIVIKILHCNIEMFDYLWIGLY